MALQSIKGGLWIPSPSEGNAAGASFTTASTLTANTHRSAYVLQAPKAGSIHKTHWRYGTVTSGASTRMQSRIEGIGSTTGDPSGSAYGGCAYGTSSIQPVSNTYDVITLGTDATVARGDFIAACIDFQTFNASDSVIIQSLGTPETALLGYYDTFGASWAKTAAVGLVGIEYSDGTFDYIPNLGAYTAITNQSFNSTTGGTDEYALSFQIPFPARVAGCAINLSVTAATQNYEINLYSGTTALQTLTASHRAYQASGSQRLSFFVFPTQQAVSANTVYRLSVRPTSSTNVGLQIYTYNSAPVLDQDEGGQNFCLGTRVDQGAWAADTTTQRPAIYIMFDQFDDGVQLGGVKTFAGLSGGATA